MGASESKQPKQPNPYSRRDQAQEYSGPQPKNPATGLRRSFSLLSPAKSLKDPLLMRRSGTVKPNNGGGAVPGAEAEAEAETAETDKNFGLSKKLGKMYQIEEEVGRGHFGYTCSAIAKKGELKGQNVAVKIIPKSKMTSEIAVENVRREITILRALSGHPNVVRFYDAFEDDHNVYLIMELCKGGELLDRILARSEETSEEWAKMVIVQILNVVAFCHLKGVVHRDLKPENFLFASEDEESELKAIDFGLSALIRPDQKLMDAVGTSHYFAPEVLHKSYGTEADVWSVGVIAYIILSGSRPFSARTESGIFREILRTEPSFDENHWPSLSAEAKDFVKRLLRKNPRHRITAAQALCHPWIRNHCKVKLPLDRYIFKVMRGYMQSSTLRRAALRALSKTLTEDELFYLKEQFALICPDEGSGITLESIKSALVKNKMDAIKESHVQDYLASLNALQYRKMYFEEFCAAAVNIHQMEAFDCWEQHVRRGYEMFEKDGNRALLIEELASELRLSPSVPFHSVLQDWISLTDGKLSFSGFTKLLCSSPST